ncbi:MAG: CsgG/HfaB family protein [Syntrophales bacterium]|nr:CsgG/HfaB family protein [Syntrophales bacterium]
MKSFKLFVVGLVLMTFLLAVSCAGSERIKVKPRAATLDQVPKTLAILPFENNSVTDPERYAPLSKGLSAMLITDLDKSKSGLKLIERDKIRDLLKEIALSQSGSVDESTAVRAGNMLGAQAIAFGSFIVLGKKVRIDARIIRVETSELIMAESIEGNSDDFMNLERELAKKIADSLKVAFQPASATSESDIDAALYFSRGLDALDRGDKEEAKRLFKKSMELDPAYKTQVDNVRGLN